MHIFLCKLLHFYKVSDTFFLHIFIGRSCGILYEKFCFWIIGIKLLCFWEWFCAHAFENIISWTSNDCLYYARKKGVLGEDSFSEADHQLKHRCKTSSSFVATESGNSDKCLVANFVYFWKNSFFEVIRKFSIKNFFKTIHIAIDYSVYFMVLIDLYDKVWFLRFI